MPRGDRTGPAGMGPMTGRAAGYCAGYGMPGFMNPAYGRGAVGYGAWGRGRGRRNWYHATGLTGWQREALGWPAGRPMGPWPYAPAYGRAYGTPDGMPYGGFTREQELGMLRDQVKDMEEGLKAAQERIAELKSQSNETGEVS